MRIRSFIKIMSYDNDLMYVWVVRETDDVSVMKNGWDTVERK